MTALLDKPTVTDVMTDLGSRVRRLREARRLTRTELAERAGIGVATLERLERGASPTLKVLLSVLEALGRLDETHAWIAPPMPRSIRELPS